LWPVTDMLNNPARRLTHEALWPTDLFKQGIGWIIVARFRSSGKRVQAGVFLLDVQCLGVKLAVLEECAASDYQERIRDHYCSRYPMVSVEPVCARKVIEQGVDYAGNFGFAPHPDYKKTARVFGGLRADECSQKFVFGRKGKPFYMRGPRETEAQARRILLHLEKRCGAGNYDFLVMAGEAADINRFFGQE
jgi:hypothetical protein